jgi:hypothetical protein
MKERSDKLFLIEKEKKPKIKFCSSKTRNGKWTKEEHDTFLKQMAMIGLKNWKLVNKISYNLDGAIDSDKDKLPNSFTFPKIY